MPPLDGLRGLAILMVMLFHYGLPLKSTSFPQNFVKVASEFGWSGVDLFFVLSGFLITGILLDSQKAENYWSSFYSRRVLRIFPVYYLSLLLVFYVVPLLAPALAQSSAHERIWYFVYLPNWVDGRGRLLTSHYWSLGIEEQFYMVWPWVVYRSTPKRILRIAIAGSVISLLLRFTLLGLHAIPDFILRNTFARMDALLIGAACTCLMRDPACVAFLRRYAAWMWIAPLVTLAVLRETCRPFGNHAPGVQGLGLTIIALSYAALLVGVVLTMGSRSILQRFFCSGFLMTFGKYSYGAYVWHNLVRLLVLKAETSILHSGVPALINIPLTIAATLVFSIASYAVVERPFLALKGRFKPRFPVPARNEEAIGLAASVD